ncbi:MAG TPA: hypothetical protein VLA24_16600, partial [Pseudomonadales bacterium]|nr:hypothetical protein [Pseudomonadales bacterium]
MRKSFTALTLAAAMFSTNAMADQATLDALSDAGVELTPEQIEEVLAAEGEAIATAIAKVVQ